MSETIRSGPPEGEFEDVADSKASLGDDDKPPTSAAVASAFLDFERKMLEQQQHHHEALLTLIRAGQSDALRAYQAEWAGHRSELASGLRRFDAEFGRAIQDLQQHTHATRGHVHSLGVRFEQNERQNAAEHKLLEERVQKLERWRYDLTVEAARKKTDAAGGSG